MECEDAVTASNCGDEADLAEDYMKLMNRPGIAGGSNS
jgi:hypothetical protein